MKKIITLLTCFALIYISGYSQTVKYNLIKNGTTIEVWANPHDASPAAVATVSANNQVTITSQVGSGATISVTNSVTGTWVKTESEPGENGAVDFSIFRLNTDPIINPFETGTNVHLFDFTLDCDEGEIALMNNGDANAPNNGSNWGNNFNVVILSPYIAIGDFYDGNEIGHEISCLGGLPVEFLSFTGRNTDLGNQLKWQTASETNNMGFEVQKSEDGISWESLDWVAGAGTSSVLNSYNLLDKFPLIGDNYYRLKQVDYDGKYEFSEVINIENLVDDIKIEVQPNPSHGDFVVNVLNPKKKKMKIVLFDSVGQLLWQSELINDIDNWRKEFTLVQKEMYFLNVQIGDERYTEKILVIDQN